MVLQQFCVHMFKYARKTNEILTIPSASQPTSQPTSQPASERANQADSQAARQPVSQPGARQPGSQAASQAAKQPDSRHPRQVLHHKVLQMTRVHVRSKSVKMCEMAKIMRRRHSLLLSGATLDTGHVCTGAHVAASGHTRRPCSTACWPGCCRFPGSVEEHLWPQFGECGHLSALGAI